MTAERVRFWKEKFEAAYRAGDKAGMVEAEKNIEAWRLWDSLQSEEQEALLKQQQERA